MRARGPRPPNGEAAHEGHLDEASVELALVVTRISEVHLQIEEARKKRVVQDQSRMVVRGPRIVTRMEEAEAPHESQMTIVCLEKQVKLPSGKQLVVGRPAREAAVDLVHGRTIQNGTLAIMKV